MKKKKRNTVGLYDVQLLPGCYLPPFLSVDDDEALNALAEMARTVPSFQWCYLRHIGSYCIDTGKIKPCKPRLLVMKREETHEVQN